MRRPPRSLALAIVLCAALTAAGGLPVDAAPGSGGVAETPARPAGADARGLAFLDRLLRGGAGACRSPGQVRDRDVRRNAASIRAAGLCVTTDTLDGAGRTWRFTAVENRSSGGPVWYLPHDNEREAFDAALYAVARYGGRLFAVESGESRSFAGVDPNRNFAATAAHARPCAIGRPAPRYTGYVMDGFRGARHILAIHNNTRGGSLTADMRTAKSTGFRASGPLSDRDHMVFIAGRLPIEQDGRARALRDRLLAAGLNVVHERVTPGGACANVRMLGSRRRSASSAGR